VTPLNDLLSQALTDEGIELPRRRVELVALRLDELVTLDREERHAAWRARTANTMSVEDR
jgi:hypothetical protein